MAGQAADSDRRSGIWIVVAGLIVMSFALGISVGKWSSAADVTSVITAFGSTVGTLVGAFFGMAVGSAGRKEAEKNAEDAHQRATMLALHVPPELRDAALQFLGVQPPGPTGD